MTNTAHLYRHSSVIVDGTLLGIVSLLGFFIILARKLRKFVIDD
jgi:hypothetical protein